MADDSKFDGGPEKKSLTDEDIVSDRSDDAGDPSRRSMLVKLGQAAGAVAIVGLMPGCHRIHRGYGYATGITDSDGGAYADPVGQGRGRAGYVSGVTDSDGGAYADPAGNGRGTYRATSYSGLTDSDGGPYADPAGQGRGRWR